MKSQVVGAGEAAAARHALEGLGAGVLPVVTRQLVRAGEAPVAALPGTPVGLLPCRRRRRRRRRRKGGRMGRR